MKYVYILCNLIKRETIEKKLKVGLWFFIKRFHVEPT